VNEYPWQVALWLNNGIWCGGSLISNQWILTAAHCTEGLSPSSLQVLLGEHDSAASTESNMVRMDIVDIKDHTKYEELPGRIPNYDFSLLKIKNSIDFSSYPHIRPICLPVNDANDYNDDVATVTGWGATSFEGPSSNKLLEVNVTVLTNTECWNDYGYSSSQITDQMLCANEVGGGKDACSGDSGKHLEMFLYFDYTS
jgi:secreted trypsin-like serine protease